MLDIALHTGTEHPDLLWILVPSLLTFISGLGLGAYSDRIRARSRPENEPATE
ncbi:hypothetical protein HTZ84_14010 [Haloterrigena sp. SYSU A558-1]|uniref:Uncharacterized protein n=1 Tax=Haloterrigena gelatinilytica TaxID=2741724 RepID=A0A8J8GIR1_9EURY|nr:hypothetical protein [Haloterrigena gelatinilytica]NUB90769.1 hypothetical protein [Haloterrigena gelatinilytica]NUC73414.1 hypothetical protein [Haloterrigena gelatinilytica]